MAPPAKRHTTASMEEHDVIQNERRLHDMLSVYGTTTACPAAVTIDEIETQSLERITVREVHLVRSSPEDATDEQQPQQYPQAALFARQYVPESAWEPDEAASGCRQCSRRFTIFNRRHHCRRCGLLFCDSCSTRRILLASPTAAAQRLCYSEPSSSTDAENSNNRVSLRHQLEGYATTTMHWNFNEYRVCDPCAIAVDALPEATTSSFALVSSRDEFYDVFQAYHGRQDYRNDRRTVDIQRNINDDSLSLAQLQQTLLQQNQHLQRQDSSSSLRQCPVCDREWTTVWGTMLRFPGEGWQETQERHIRECIEDASAEMQGSSRHRGGNSSRRSCSVQPRPAAQDIENSATSDQPSSSQPPRRSVGFLNFFERSDTTTSASHPIGEDNESSPRQQHLQVSPPSKYARSPAGVKYVVYKLNSDTPLLGQECVICFEDFEPGQRVARLNCLCTYHVWCITEWLHRTPACPVHYE